MDRYSIENRKVLNISVVVDEAEMQRGLVFVMHGLGGFKEQDHIRVIAEAFSEKDFTIVRFDTTNSLGESEGAYDRATVTNYYEDLEDVIQWAAGRTWYREHFVLAGHSIGALCAGLFAQQHPEKILALAPISPVVDGNLSLEAYQGRDSGRPNLWKETGWSEEKNLSRPGVMTRLPWSHMEDRLKYSLFHEVKKLTMPVLVIVGATDSTTPVDHVKIFFDALPGRREFHIIKSAPHTFRNNNQLRDMKALFLHWIKSLSAQ